MSSEIAAREEFDKLFRFLQNCDSIPTSIKDDFWKFVDAKKLNGRSKEEIVEGAGKKSPFTYPSSTNSFQDDLEEELITFFHKRGQLYVSLMVFLFQELSLSSPETLFRNKSLALSILSRTWFKKDGTVMLERLQKPIEVIAKSKTSLEISPDENSNCYSVKKNMKILLNTLDSLLKIILDSECYTEDFRFLFTAIDKAASVKFSQNGYSIIGGVLFLRLINPAILFPENYGLVPQSDITPHGRQALFYIGKMLQVMANNSQFQEREAFMAPANRFIRLNLPKWFDFFHQLVTGVRVIRSPSTITPLPVTAEDLIATSNHDIYRTLICPRHLGKQKEVILHLFQLEKQMEGWKENKKEGHSLYFKKFPNSSVILCKYVLEVPASIPEVFDFIKKKCSGNLTQEEKILEHKEVERFNDNLSVQHTKLKTSFPLLDRDFVSLNYSEILLEDGFAINCYISIDRPDVPPEKDFVRAEIEGGFILRAGSKSGTCGITYISHFDGKGWTKQAPSSLMKRLVKNTAEKEVEQLLKKFSPN